ncbi:hypothetical protein CLOM_g15201 [Closterium sp. NIES-68]|nr:hypothetical protein CLOM_g15201 [Closterium sp. NIES-68]GJP78797.1 hypothetical protein CLOP_g9069 [Closterium sp. NIES-67]
MAGYVSLRGSDDPQDEGLLGGTSSHAGEDWKVRLATMGKKMGESMTAVGGKLTESMTEIGGKMKNIFHTPTLADRLVEEATDEILISPDWGRNLLICDLVNSGKLQGGETVRAIKKQLASRNSHVQMLALALLEMGVKNCSSLFSDVANERVLDDMVRVVDEPGSAAQLREKVLKMIEAWGEATEELRYLPVFEETYKSLKMRGVVFPPRDAESLAPIFTPPASVPPAAVQAAHALLESVEGQLASEVAPPGVSMVPRPEGGHMVVFDSKEIFEISRNSVELLGTVLSSAPPEQVLTDEVVPALAAQCRAAKSSLLRLIEHENSATEAPSETLLFEALSLNDDVDKVLEKLAELRKQGSPNAASGGAGTGAGAGEGQGAVEQPAGAAATAVPPVVPPPAAAFLSMDEEEEGGAGGLVRNRGGANQRGAAGVMSEEERELAELDEMVFGRKEGGGGGSAGAGGGAGSTQSGATKKDEDDLIVF